MISLAAFLPPLAIGLLVVLIAWPGPYRRDMLFKLPLSAAAGLGITSCTYFAWCLLFRPRSRAYFLAEFLLAALLLCLAVILRRKKAGLEPLFPSLPRPGKLAWALIIAAVIALILAAGSFLLLVQAQPHGIQDAWNIWNMRARFMARGASQWTDLFSPDLYWLNHPDYPFLVTAGVARAWSFAGGENTLIPILQAGIFALALAGMLFAVVAARRGWDQGAVAVILLAGTPLFPLLAGWQIADVPLAALFCATLILLLLALEHPRRPGLAILFGLCAGLAAWTKNEGIPWLFLSLGVFLAAYWGRRKTLRTAVTGIMPVIAGAALPASVLAYLKFFLAPASDLFAGQTSLSLMERLSDPARYGLTLEYTLKALAGFSPIGLSNLPVLLIALTGLALLFPTKEKRGNLHLLLYPAALALLQGAGYFAIYLITPHDLVWHLRTAMDRLIFHLTPAALLLVFLAARTPDEIVNGLRTSKAKS